ncbi:MAG: DUF2723 domain-containing protein [Chloroflexi bacterium]|nr:DUF2723 domain-containing protein [Chloroflexota bacterium]
MNRKDSLISSLLFVLVLATRLPFRTHILFNWDSANFALALRKFDVTQHFPHPPGYPYYIALAKFFNLFFANANTSLVMVSILLSAGSAVALYFLGKNMFNRRTGIIAGLLLTFGVTFWSYGEIALAYGALALFSTWVALWAYQILFQKRNLLLPLTAVYTIAGGFRPDLLLFLGPLWLATLWRQPPRMTATALGLALAGFLLWFLPTALLSGGIDQYLKAFEAYVNKDVLERYSVLENGWIALRVNIKDTLSYLFYVLYAAAPLLVVATAWLLGQRARFNSQILFIILWLSPMAIFYTFVHIGDPGYVFSVVPALFLITGLFFSKLKPPALSWGLLGLVVSANIIIFLFLPRTLTLPGLRDNDRALGEKREYILSNYSPQSVILLSYDSYRHWRYYLPQYSMNLWVDMFGKGNTEVVIPTGVKSVLLIEDKLGRINQSSTLTQKIVLPGMSSIYRLTVEPGDRLIYGSQYIEVKKNLIKTPSFEGVFIISNTPTGIETRLSS